MIPLAVIVPTLNSFKSARRLIDSLPVINPECIEFIVVDNHSQDFDPLAELVISVGGSIFSYGPERSAQRNFGARIASAKWLLFLDSDMYLPSDFITSINNDLKMLETQGAIAAILTERPTGKGFWISAKVFERESIQGRYECTAARLIRRDIFFEIGEFNELNTGTEDFDLHDRLLEKGFTIKTGSTIVYHDESSFSLLKSINKKSYYGSSVNVLISNKRSRYRWKYFIFKRAYYLIAHLREKPSITLFARALFIKLLEALSMAFGRIRRIP